MNNIPEYFSENVLTVSELNGLVKELFDNVPVFSYIKLRGEISNFTNHRSGHFYFTLKDDASAIKAVMFRGNNAHLKFTPENGKIRVYIQSVAGEGLVVGVQDSGMGMTKQECELVFDRFYKSDSARTPGGGYGLGLSIVQQIVQLHKASIRAESEKGKGTCFILTFPPGMVV